MGPYPSSHCTCRIYELSCEFGCAHGVRNVTRYFNAAGAGSDGELGEVHNPETHFVPFALLRARQRVTMRWGSCSDTFNLRNGRGFPCHQGCEAATGRKIEMQFSGRRERDLPELLSESRKLESTLTIFLYCRLKQLSTTRVGPVQFLPLMLNELDG